MTGENVSRPAFRYHGSKFMLAQWIIDHFAPHECYVEPYGGSAAVLLQKPRSWLEIYNEKSNQVVNFFRVLREQTDDLVKVIELTPYAKTEWELSFEDDPDPVERARRFYIRAYLSLAGPTAQKTNGWRRQKVISKDKDNKKEMTPASISFMNTDYLYAVANRLRGVQIECDEALTVIERYDSSKTLFYLDPPYISSTRSYRACSAYEYEMTNKDHEELAAVLHSIQGMAMISGYQCELYDELYTNWLRADKQVRVNGRHYATESLWLSPALVENQLPLFRPDDAVRDLSTGQYVFQ